jgi:hypothetical protein
MTAQRPAPRQGLPLHERAALTQCLQLAPQLALLAPHAVHDLRDPLKCLLKLLPQAGTLLPLPQPALVKGQRARGMQLFVADLGGRGWQRASGSFLSYPFLP